MLIISIARLCHMSRTILRFSPSPRSPRPARTTSPTRCRAGDKRKGEGEAPHVRAGRNAGRNGAPRRSMPDGEKSGTGRGSPSRQGRTGSRTEWARHPAQCRAVSAHGRAERRVERNALPHQGRTGKRKNAVPASRFGAAPGEKHIDAGRGKCGTGRGSYRIRAGRGRRTGRGWRRGRRGARWRGLRRRRRSAPFGKAPPRRGRRARRPP